MARRRLDGEEDERPRVKRQLTAADQDEWASVSAALWAYYHQHRHTEDLLARKLELHERLLGKLRTLFPQCCLYIVGSSLTGFGSNRSDADMCLVITMDQVDQQRQAKAILTRVARLLTKTGWCMGGRPEVIHAKVPIVRFRDRTTGVEVDINVNNVVGLRNTRLLQCYAQLDSRTAPLVLAVKAWASRRHINEAKHGTLSSYSLALMVIQYLQCGCEPAVLPSLQKMQPGRFCSDGDVRLLRLGEDLPPWQSANTQSLGALFIGFLDYFANRFGFSRSCVSVRQGAPISRLEAVSATGTARRSQWKYICVEEGILNVQSPTRMLENSRVTSAQVKLSDENKGNGVKPDARTKNQAMMIGLLGHIEKYAEPFDQSNTARAVYNWDMYQLIVRAFHDTLEQLQKSHNPECLLLHSC